MNESIGILQKAHTRAINKEKGWTGSLFRGDCKAKDGWIDEFITLRKMDGTLDYRFVSGTGYEHQAYMKELLARIDETVVVNNSISQRAAFLVSNGIKPLDALHLACAEEAKADYFCTSDDKFLKKAKKLANTVLEVVSPLKLVTKLP